MGGLAPIRLLDKLNTSRLLLGGVLNGPEPIDGCCTTLKPLPVVPKYTMLLGSTSVISTLVAVNPAGMLGCRAKARGKFGPVVVSPSGPR